MLYLEVLATNGTGWRIPIPPDKIQAAKNGVLSIGDISFNIDETCTLMDAFRIVTKRIDAFGNETYPVLFTGSIGGLKRNVLLGDTLALSSITISTM